MAKIRILLLAAGLSRRFGENKLLADYQGRPLFEYSAEALAQVCQQRDDCALTVVTRYPQVAAYAARLGAHVVWNYHSELGISSSLHLGLEDDPAAEYYLCAVADQPELNAPLVLDFLQALLTEGAKLGSVCHQGVPGNPGLFHRSYLPELLALQGDRGGRVILNRHIEDCVFWECPALHDIDTKQDLCSG